MIDGKLETQGRQPSDVQVVIESSGSQTVNSSMLPSRVMKDHVIRAAMVCCTFGC